MVLNLGVLAIRRYIMFEQVTRFTAMLNLLCNRGMKIQTQDPVSCLAITSSSSRSYCFADTDNFLNLSEHFIPASEESHEKYRFENLF